MERFPRRRFLALLGTAGTVALAGCQETLLEGVGSSGDDRSSLGEGKENLPFVLSEGGPGRLSDSDDVHSGWIHVVAHGEAYDVTFDARICHEKQDDVEVNLRHSIGNEYELALSTTGNADETTESDGADETSNCDFGTRFKGGGSIPNDWETLRITSNGETIQTVKREGTFAVMRPLPDPVDAT